MQNICTKDLGSEFQIISVILIYKTDSSNLIKKETIWMRTLRTTAIYDINVENDV